LLIWSTPPKIVSIVSGEVHVWRGLLEEGAGFPAETLSNEELQRGQRFLREEHRRRFCQARAFLRRILAYYLRIDPALIRFREGPHGKLYLNSSLQQLQFNVSHSRDLALYAVTVGQEVGIDIEWMNPEVEIQPLVSRFFTPQEQQAFAALPTDQQLTAFYHLWTRKEAYLKAQGWGLAGLSRTMPESDPGIVMSLEPASEYAGALALTETNSLIANQISYFEING
jgi:4'-phosphopantetheinyl transferase